MVNLGGQVRLLRMARGWDEADLGRMIHNEVGVNMGVAGIKRLEAGRARVPQLLTLVSIAGIFETTIDALLAATDYTKDAAVSTSYAARAAQLRESEEQHRAAKTALQTVIEFAQGQQRDLERRADVEAQRADARERR